MYNEKLILFIEENKSSMLKDLCNFIEIASISSDKEKVNEALSFALSLGEKFGFKTNSYLDDQVGVITMGAGSETLGILSHVDVVSAGDESAWNTPPFKAIIKDSRIYGRGALDDKGAIIASLYAMKAVYELGIPFQKEVQLILGTQEEVEWTDMDAYVQQFSLPDYGFTPDGEFPLCNIEKGSLDITMEFPIGYEFSHITDGKFLYSLSAGTAPNVVPEICTAEIATVKNGVLEVSTVSTLGKAVHSCQPEKGINSILLMSEKLKTLNLVNNPMLNLLDMITENFSDLYGKSLGLCSDTEFYNGEFVHRNVFSPNILSVENSTLSLTVNVRYPFGANSNEILLRFDSLAKQYNGVVKQHTDLPAVYISKDSRFLQSFAQAYEQVRKCKNEFVLAYGGSYAKAMPNIVSWGPIFPGEEDTCHEANEYISVQSLIDNAKIFSIAIHDIALSTQSFK